MGQVPKSIQQIAQKNITKLKHFLVRVRVTVCSLCSLLLTLKKEQIQNIWISGCPALALLSQTHRTLSRD